MMKKSRLLLTFCTALSVIYCSTAFAAQEITAEKAKEIALAKTGGGTVTECKPDYDDGRKFYEIEIINAGTKYEMDVAADNSQIYDYEQETYAGYSGTEEITAEAAQRIALEKTKGGEVISCKLDFEDGVKIYEVDIVHEDIRYEVDISVTDSTILKFEQETMASYNTSVSGNTEISADRAKEIALAKTGGGTVTKCKLEYEHGRKVYEIKIVSQNTSYELDVCVTNSQIYDYEQETVNDTHDNKQADSATNSSSTKITAERAKEIALAKTGGGTVIKCEFDYDDGRAVYEIEIRNGRTEYEMNIGAEDGSIFDFEMDYDD